MKITNINIQKFGKFLNKQLDICEDIQVIYGDNESGKTTIMNFIKLMFYSDTATRGIESPRKKYTPWNNSGMGGSITIKNEKITAQLTKQIGETKAKDRTILTDILTGKRVDSLLTGCELFYINRYEYELSGFIEESGKIDSKETYQLSAKLLELLSNTGVSNNCASKNLDNALKKLRALRGSSGFISELEKELEELKKEYTYIKYLQSQHSSLIDEQLSLDTQLQQIDISKQLNKLYQRKKLIEEQLKLIDEAYTIEHSLKSIFKLESWDDITRVVNETRGKILLAKQAEIQLCELKVPDTTEIADIESIENTCKQYKSIIRLIDTHKELARLTENLSLLEQTQVEDIDIDSLNLEYHTLLETKIGKVTEKQDLKDKLNHKACYTELIIAAIICILSIITGIIINNKLLWLIAVPALAYGIITFIGKSSKLKLVKSNILKLERQIEQIELSAASLSMQIDKVKLKENEAISNRVKIQDIQALIKGKQIIIDELEDSSTKVKLYKLEEMIKSFNDVVEKYKLGNAEECIARLSEYKNRQIEIEKLKKQSEIIGDKQSRETTDKIIESFDRYNIITTSINKWFEDNKTTENIVRAEIAEIDAKSSIYDIPLELLSKTTEELDSMTKEINKRKLEITASLVERHRNLNTVEEEINELESRIYKANTYYKALSIAKETLIESEELMQQLFSPALNSRTSEIIAQITGGKYENVLIDKEFNINVMDNEVYQSYANLSKGTIAQLYLALRIAICEIIAYKETVPIIIDDAFNDYDTERLTRVMQFLKNYSTSRQVIIFTCRKDLVDICINEQIDIIEL